MSPPIVQNLEAPLRGGRWTLTKMKCVPCRALEAGVHGARLQCDEDG